MIPLDWFAMPVSLHTPHPHLLSPSRQDSRKFQAGSPTGGGGSSLGEMPFAEETDILLRVVTCPIGPEGSVEMGRAEEVRSGEGQESRSYPPLQDHTCRGQSVLCNHQASSQLWFLNLGENRHSGVQRTQV